MVCKTYGVALAALAVVVGALPNAAPIARIGAEKAVPVATGTPAVSRSNSGPNVLLDGTASPPWGKDVQPVFVLQGGGDQAAEDACGMAIQSAKVMVASMTASIRSASQTAWDAATPTFSIELGGPNRKHGEWVQCLHKRTTQAEPPWGNGVVPAIIMDPGRPIGNRDVCSRNSRLLTSMFSRWMHSVSETRNYKAYDRHTPTWAIVGGDCVTEHYRGPADRFYLITGTAPQVPRPSYPADPPPRDEGRRPWQDPRDGPREPPNNPWASPLVLAPQPTWRPSPPKPVAEPAVTVTVWVDE